MSQICPGGLCSAPGEVHVTTPVGDTISGSFVDVFASAATQAGTCPAADMVDYAPTTVLPADASITCYAANSDRTAYSVYDTCAAFPQMSGSYSGSYANVSAHSPHAVPVPSPSPIAHRPSPITHPHPRRPYPIAHLPSLSPSPSIAIPTPSHPPPVSHQFYARVTNATSGIYAVRTSGTNQILDGCPNGGTHPCGMSASTSYTFELAVAGCGLSCPNALPWMGVDVDPASLRGCDGSIAVRTRTPSGLLRNPRAIAAYTDEAATPPPATVRRWLIG
jgi:hypothetical protein